MDSNGILLPSDTKESFTAVKLSHWHILGRWEGTGPPDRTYKLPTASVQGQMETLEPSDININCCTTMLFPLGWRGQIKSRHRFNVNGGKTGGKIRTIFSASKCGGLELIPQWTMQAETPSPQHLAMERPEELWPAEVWTQHWKVGLRWLLFFNQHKHLGWMASYPLSFFQLLRTSPPKQQWEGGSCLRQAVVIHYDELRQPHEGGEPRATMIDLDAENWDSIQVKHNTDKYGWAEWFAAAVHPHSSRLL